MDLQRIAYKKAKKALRGIPQDEETCYKKLTGKEIKYAVIASVLTVLNFLLLILNSQRETTLLSSVLTVIISLLMTALLYAVAQIGMYIDDFKTTRYSEYYGEIRKKELDEFKEYFFPAGLKENKEIEEIDQAIKNCVDELKKLDNKDETARKAFWGIITALGSGILLRLIPITWKIANCQNGTTIELFVYGLAILILLFIAILIIIHTGYKLASPRRKLNRQLKDLRDLKESYVKRLENSNKSGGKK